MHDLLFARQEALNEERLVGYAAEPGLDLEAFRQALREGGHKERVDRDFRSGMRSGVRGTPHLLRQRCAR